MVRTKYTKLSSKQKLEIIEYWCKFHYPYASICEYFKVRWNQEVNVSTVADIIQQWKKKKSIRGITKVSYQDSVLLYCIQEVVNQVNEIGYSLSKQSLHAICLGELVDNDLDTSFAPLEKIEALLQENQLHLSPCFSSSRMEADHSYMHHTIQEYVQSSSVLFLDTFHLFFRCLPYKPIAYPLHLNSMQFREKMEVMVTFSLDGSIRVPLFIHGRRFTSHIADEWSILKRKKRKEQGALSISASDMYSYLKWMDHFIPSSHVLVLTDIHHVIKFVEEDNESNTQVIHFQTSEKEDVIPLELRKLHIILTNPLLFSSICPFNYGIHSSIVKGYRTRLLRELISMQHNNRGYKRILPIETCYQLLSSCWKELPDCMFRDCACQSKLVDFTPDEPLLVYEQIETELGQAIEEFNHTFKIITSELMSTGSYATIEMIPYLSGIGSIHECLRTGYESILFNHSHYPQSPLFPEPLYFLQDHTSNCLVVADHPQVISISDIQPSVPISLEFQPSRETISLFCTCLDSFLQQSTEFTSEEQSYYDLLKERIHNHFCKLYLVFKKHKYIGFTIILHEQNFVGILFPISSKQLRRGSATIPGICGITVINNDVCIYYQLSFLWNYMRYKFFNKLCFVVTLKIIMLIYKNHTNEGTSCKEINGYFIFLRKWALRFVISIRIRLG